MKPSIKQWLHAPWADGAEETDTASWAGGTTWRRRRGPYRRPPAWRGAGRIVIERDRQPGGQDGIGATLVAAAGATAGLVVVVYAAGAALLRVRYGQARLTEDPLVAALPREYLAVIGVRSIVLPAVIVAAIAVFLVYLPGRSLPPRILALAGCAAAMLITVAIAVHDGVSEPDEWQYRAQYVLVIGGLLASLVAAFIAVKRPRSRSTVLWLVGACAIVAAIGYRFASEWGEPLSLPPARVVMAGDRTTDAYFISANPQQVVLGLGLCDAQSPDARRLGGAISVPLSQVTRIVTADAVKIHHREEGKKRLWVAIERGLRSQGGSDPKDKALTRKPCE